jgi:hypothetical protein
MPTADWRLDLATERSLTAAPIAIEITIAIPANTIAPLKISIPPTSSKEDIRKPCATIRSASIYASISGVVTVNKLGALLIQM